jgi:capsular polysaccharide transport system permease protein
MPLRQADSGLAMVDFVRPTGRDAAVIGGVRPNVAGKIAAFFASLNIWFWALVGLPTLLAGVYFFGIASDLYTSEAEFVVHGPSKAPTGGIGALLGSAASPVSDETYEVHEYLLSRDAVRRLDNEANLRAVLSRPNADIISRFPGIRWRKDFEALYDAYSRFVSIQVDSTNGISTLMVKAYRPEDAEKIAQALLKFSEQLVNALNDRARHDSLAVFQHEVDTTQQRIAQIQSDLTAYRVKEKMLDPKSAAVGPIELLGQMNAQLANAKSQLAEVMKNSPQSPQIPYLKTRITTLERQIVDQHSKITGDNNSLASTVGEYERLDVQKLLAEKELASAYTSLEGARLEAQRQQLYLETIAQPNLADYPLYPRRIISFGTVVVICLLTYGIAWLLVAGVRDHASA